jgi:alpha-tubulin suppressor-like RCC1 family protein
MPNQFLFEEGPFNVANDIEESFATDYWLFEQYIGDQLFVWGNNGSGQIGDNTRNLGATSRSTPKQEFTSSTNWKQVVRGGPYSAAIKTDGTLWCWGNNLNGQVADNTNVNRSTPRQEITSNTNWKQIAGGQSHTAAIKTDGTLWCWGQNIAGEIGDNTAGSTIGRSTPRQEITSSTNWKQVACGTNYTAAIKTDGTLWCWGINSSGQIGDNTIIARSTPRQELTSSTNWKQVSCGYTHAAAIKTNGTLWCWGSNGNGQIGDNTFGATGRSTPRQEITSSTNWKQVSAGANNTTAIKTNGTLWCWGQNDLGQIGDNTVGNSRSTPVQEWTSSTNWKQVSASDHTAAIKTDGTLWCWGNNSSGQLGDFTLFNRSTPRQEITSSTNWKQVSLGAGGINTAAIKTGINIDTGIPTN